MKTSIEIPSVLGAEKIVLELLEKALQHSVCRECDRMDIRTAAAEACLNAIEHGNRLDPALMVKVCIQVTGSAVIVDVCDHGSGADLRALCDRQPLQTDSSRGHGLYLISRLIDKWNYCYQPENKLFCVRLKKFFTRAGNENGCQ